MLIKTSDIFNLANWISFSRVLIIPVLLYFLFDVDGIFGSKTLVILVVCVLYSIGCLTDYFDGYIARKYSMQSRFGIFFDPLADKIFHISIMVSFLFINGIDLSSFLVGSIVFRELFITGMRIYAIQKNKEMATEKHGKVKTVIQIVSQSFVLAVLLHNSIIFDMQSFKDFLVQHKSQLFSFINIQISTFDNFIREVIHYPDWLALTIHYIPNFFFTVSFYFTIKSGIMYVYNNRKLFA